MPAWKGKNGMAKGRFVSLPGSVSREARTRQVARAAR